MLDTLREKLYGFINGKGNNFPAKNLEANIMAKKNTSTTYDEDGVSVGVEINSNRIAEKSFGLSSKDSAWPLDSEGKPVSLTFNVLIDMNGVSYASVVDDAIRTKIIRLQNALRKNFSFEALREMSRSPLRKTYENVGVVGDSPEKAFTKLQATASSLTPEQAAAMIEMLQKVASQAE